MRRSGSRLSELVMRWSSRSGCAAALVGLALSVTAWTDDAGAVIAFQDVSAAAGTAQSGLTYGASWGDFDSDGWPDLWVGNHYSAPSLYRNRGDGTFEEIAGEVWPGPVRDTHGAAWADFDRDGDEDLVELVGGDNPNHLWINENGVLIDRAATWGVGFPGMRARSPLWLDWNRDGLLDLLLTHAAGGGSFPTVLRNTGTTFVDATSEVQVPSPSSAHAQLGDLNSDGEADLLFEGAGFPSPVYDVTQIPFVNIRSTLQFGLHGSSFGMDGVVADFSGDGRNDFFFPKQGGNFQLVVENSQHVEAKLNSQANERGVTFEVNAPVQVSVYPEFISTPGALIRIGAAGNPATTFDVALNPTDPSVAGIAPHTPGAGLALYLGFTPPNQWSVLFSSATVQVLNVVITSSAPMENVTPVGFVANPPANWPFYYESTPTGFVDRRSLSGFAMGAPCNSAVSGDFDNDSDIDLYLACSQPVSNHPNMLFENNGIGRFSLVSGAGGAAGSTEGRGESVVTVDYDRDGFLDLLVTNGEGREPFNDGPLQLFRNLGNGNHWLEVDLVGCESNQEGIGAEVILTAGGKTQMRTQDGGMHRHAQNHRRLHFGLGVQTLVDDLEVRWPSGTVDVLNDVIPDRILVLAEGRGGASTCSPSVSTSSPRVAVLLAIALTAIGSWLIWSRSASDRPGDLRTGR